MVLDNFYINHIVVGTPTDIKVSVSLRCTEEGKLFSDAKCTGLCYECKHCKSSIKYSDTIFCDITKKKEIDRLIDRRLIELSSRLLIDKCFVTENMELRRYLYDLRTLRDENIHKNMDKDDLDTITDSWNKLSKLKSYFTSQWINPENLYLENLYKDYKIKLKDEVKELYENLKEKYKDGLNEERKE